MKRWFFMVLAALALLAFPAFAGTETASSEPEAIAGVYERYWEDGSFLNGISVNGAIVEDPEQMAAQPGDELRIYLPPEAFADNLGGPLQGKGITAKQLSDAKIQARHKVAAGSKAIKETGIESDRKTGRAYIYVRFVDGLAQTKDMPFELQLYLNVNGAKSAVTECRLAGTFSNVIIPVSSADDYVDLSGGAVAEASGYVKDISVYLGDGVTILSNFFEGSRYYGVAEADSGEDDYLLSLYPEIVHTYTLQTIGLKREGRGVVTFDVAERYYVYNQDGVYIGTTDKAVPYATKYFLTGKKLERIDVSDTV